LEENAASLTVNLTKWQQNMLKDMFGVKTTKLDIIEEVRAQRMYLEDDQKAQIAKILGMKAAKMCNYIELDPEVIVKYAAMQRYPVLYGGLPVSE
jgi:NADH:ubiquinone oxidoreductase subunit E